MTHQTDTAQTWRDLIDQLTTDQIAILEAAEQSNPNPADSSTGRHLSDSSMLDWARERAEHNAKQARLDARLGHVEIPAGATTTGWLATRADDGDAGRTLTWASFDTECVSVAIDGFQEEDGSFTCGISLGRRPGKYGAVDDLSAIDARELAQALAKAADALDALTAAM